MEDLGLVTEYDEGSFFEACRRESVAWVCGGGQVVEIRLLSSGSLQGAKEGLGCAK